MPRLFTFSTALMLLALLYLNSGCATYAAPGRIGEFRAMDITQQAQAEGTQASIRELMERKPLASFPASVAIVRVQEPGYQSRTADGWGVGRYSIVTTRDVEKPEQMQRLAKLPMVRGAIPINRMLLPQQLTSDLDLRQAAAQLQADLLLLYTLDTSFYVRDMNTPVTVISLGLAPNQEARIVTTASAVIMDTRNGYIYGAAEETETSNQVTTAWTSENTIDANRIRTETKAFAKLVDALEVTWTSVLKEQLPATQPVALR